MVTKSLYPCINVRRRSNWSPRMYGETSPPPSLCANAASANAQGVSVCSSAHVRKVARNPCVVMCSKPALRRSMVKAMFDNSASRPRLDGNIRPSLLRLDRALALSKTASAPEDNGTRCGSLIFMCSAGFSQMAASMFNLWPRRRLGEHLHGFGDLVVG